jgi:hypothetical protein
MVADSDDDADDEAELEQLPRGGDDDHLLYSCSWAAERIGRHPDSRGVTAFQIRKVLGWRKPHDDGPTISHTTQPRYFVGRVCLDFLDSLDSHCQLLECQDMHGSPN